MKMKRNGGLPGGRLAGALAAEWASWDFCRWVCPGPSSWAPSLELSHPCPLALLTGENLWHVWSRQPPEASGEPPQAAQPTRARWLVARVCHCRGLCHLLLHRLFPLREPGVNCHAKPLTLQEVEVSLKARGGAWLATGVHGPFRSCWRCRS